MTAPRPWLLALLLGAATLLVFSPAVRFGYLTLDDSLYLWENPGLKGGWEGIRDSFSTLTSGIWIPVTTLSFTAEHSVFGWNPAASHGINAVLHAANAALLFFLLLRMTGKPGRSLAAAALFALHPMRVESVAWVSERKDVLALLFALLSAACHLRYARSGRPGWYLATALLFGIGLLCKPTLVAFPLLLLLLDFWPLGRTGEGQGRPGVPIPRLVLEKVPLLAFSTLVSWLAVSGHRTALTGVGNASSLLGRIELPPVIVLDYLRDTFWPAGLSLTPMAPPLPSPWHAAGAASLLLLVTSAAWRGRREAPWAAVGWTWFLVALLPNSGIFLPSMFAVGDRLTYLPHIGLSVAAAWGGWELIRRLPAARLGATFLVIAAALLLAAGASALLPSWRSPVSLYQRGVAARPSDHFLRMLLSQSLQDEGRAGEALAQAREAVRLAPGEASSHRALARALWGMGRDAEAVGQLREALSLPGDPTKVAPTLVELARLLRRTGTEGDVANPLRLALRRDPRSAEANLLLGMVLRERGEGQEAARHIEEASRLAPADPLPPLLLGEELRRAGRPTEAWTRYREAAARAPASAEAAFARGRMRELEGRPAGAAREFRAADRLPPANPSFGDAIRSADAAKRLEGQVELGVAVEGARPAPRDLPPHR